MGRASRATIWEAPIHYSETTYRKGAQKTGPQNGVNKATISRALTQHLVAIREDVKNVTFTFKFLGATTQSPKWEEQGQKGAQRGNLQSGKKWRDHLPKKWATSQGKVSFLHLMWFIIFSYVCIVKH